MLPYIPPPRPVRPWEIIALGLGMFAAPWLLLLAIKVFFGSMPLAERLVHLVVDRL